MSAGRDMRLKIHIISWQYSDHILLAQILLASHQESDSELRENSDNNPIARDKLLRAWTLNLAPL